MQHFYLASHIERGDQM